MIPVTMRSHRRTIQRGPPRGGSACFAAVAGLSTPNSAGRRCATMSRPGSASATWACEFPLSQQSSPRKGSPMNRIVLPMLVLVSLATTSCCGWAAEPTTEWSASRSRSRKGPSAEAGAGDCGGDLPSGTRLFEKYSARRRRDNCHCQDPIILWFLQRSKAIGKCARQGRRRWPYR
jgi:hypothetical protein